MQHLLQCFLLLSNSHNYGFRFSRTFCECHGKKKAWDNEMVILKIQCTELKKYSHSEQQQMSRKQNPATNFSSAAAQHRVNVNQEHCNSSRNSPESAQGAPCPQPCSTQPGCRAAPISAGRGCAASSAAHWEGRAEGWEEQIHFY